MEIAVRVAATHVAVSVAVYTTDTLPLTTIDPGNAPATKVIVATGTVLSTLKALLIVEVAFSTSSLAVTRIVYVPSSIL